MPRASLEGQPETKNITWTCLENEMVLPFFVLTFDLSASSRPSNGRSAPSVTAQESGQPLPSDECETNFTDKIFLTIGSSNQFTKETVKFWSHFVAGTSGLQGALCTIQVQPAKQFPILHRGQGAVIIEPQKQSQQNLNPFQEVYIVVCGCGSCWRWRW